MSHPIDCVAEFSCAATFFGEEKTPFENDRLKTQWTHPGMLLLLRLASASLVIGLTLPSNCRSVPVALRGSDISVQDILVFVDTFFDSS